MRGGFILSLLPLLFLILSLYVTSSEQQCAQNQNYVIKHQPSLKSNATNTIRLGVIGTLYSVATLSPGSIMRFAAERFNNNPDILPDTKIELAFIPNTAADLSSNLLLTLFAIQNLSVDGIIGGISTTESRVIQLAAKLYNVPQISAHALGSILANRDEYPYYAVTQPFDSIQIDTIVALYGHFGWRRGIILYSDNDYGTGFNSLVVQGAEIGVNFIGYSIGSSVTTVDGIMAQMKQVQHQLKNNRYRTVVLYLTAASTALVMEAANELGIVGDQYTYVLSTNAAGVYTQTLGAAVLPYLKGSIAITLAFPSGEFYNQEIAAYKEYQANFPGSYINITAANQFFWVTYDPVMTYAYAYDALLKQYPFASITGQMLYNQILNTTFTGVSGYMVFNPTGDRKGFYSIQNFQEGKSVEVAQYSAITKTILTSNTTHFIFYDGTGNVPDDGSAREFNPALSGGLGAVIGVGVLVAIFAVVMLAYHWNAYISKYGTFYCGVILAGVLTSYVAALSLLPKPTDALCLVFPWFLGISFTLVYGCLFIKAWILYRLWRYALQLKRMSITALTVVKYVGVALAFEIVLLIVWSSVDPPKVHMVIMVDDTIMPMCRSDTSIFWIIFLAMKGAWLLFGVVVSVLTRSVVKEYNNFTEFVYAMYNILIMVIIAVPLGILLQEVPNGLMIVSVIVIVTAFTFSTVILFFNIWYSLLYNDTGLTIQQATSRSSRSHSHSPHGSHASNNSVSMRESARESSSSSSSPS